MNGETGTFKKKEKFEARKERGIKSISWGIILLIIGIVLIGIFFTLSSTESYAPPEQDQSESGAYAPSPLEYVPLIVALAGLITSIAGLVKAITGVLTVILAYMEKKKADQINQGSNQ